MSHMCASCTHLGSEHPGGGSCVGECLDPDTGDFYVCPCPVFERDDYPSRWDEDVEAGAIG